MLYKDPKNMLQLKINEALGSGEESIVSDLIKLSLLKKASKNSDNLVYTEVYNLLGLEKFSELVTLLDGKALALPTKDDLKDTVTMVLCYYYRNIEHKNWDDIKSILGIPDINTIKQGIRSSQFEAYLKEMISKRLMK